MLEQIQHSFSRGKAWVQQAIMKLVHLLILGIKKVIGDKKYAALESACQQAIGFYESKQQALQAYYDARVDKNSPYYKPIVRMWRITGKTIFYGLVYLFVIETNIFWLTGQMPSVDDLQNPKLSQASEIYSADGVLLGKYFAENRTPIRDYNLISPYLVKALVATEDARFYEHTGIDFQAWAGVAIGIVKGGDRGGGSTISQQLAKNLFKTRTKKSFTKTGLLGYIPGLNKLVYKTKEWVTAIKLERFYTKDEIILWYLNTVDYGNNAYGIKVAAKTYFNTSADSLNIQEAA
ncbi:MAG: hypothetical protein RL127_1515, partial [Bacteroidota bacterium]